MLSVTDLEVRGGGVYDNYPVPGIVTTAAGTILVYYEGRGTDINQRGLIFRRSEDGGECAKEAYRSAGLYESAKYVAEADYAYPMEKISFSTKFWNSLSPEDQAIIEECAAEAAAAHTAKIATQWEQDKEFLINEGGVTFCDIDRQAFIDAAAPLGAELQASDFFSTENLYDLTRQFNG